MNEVGAGSYLGQRMGSTGGRLARTGMTSVWLTVSM
jgi:hypothetical protein